MICFASVPLIQNFSELVIDASPSPSIVISNPDLPSTDVDIRRPVSTSTSAVEMEKLNSVVANGTNMDLIDGHYYLDQTGRTEAELLEFIQKTELDLQNHPCMDEEGLFSKLFLFVQTIGVDVF